MKKQIKRFAKRSFLRLSALRWMMLLLLFPILTLTASALPTVGTVRDANCWYTTPTGNVLKIVIDPTYFRAITNHIYPNTVKFSVRLYSSCPAGTLLGTFPVVSSAGNVLLFNVGTLTPNYYFEIVQEHYAPGATTPYFTFPWSFPGAINSYDCPNVTIYENQHCEGTINPPGENEAFESACYYEKLIDGAPHYYMRVRLSTAALFFLAANPSYLIKFSLGGNAGSHIIDPVPVSVIGDEYTFDVTSLFPLSGTSCMDYVYIRIYNSPPAPPPAYTAPYATWQKNNVCKCDDAPCDPEFSIYGVMYDGSNANFGVNGQYVGSTLVDEYTISSGGYVLYTYPASAFAPTLPYGTYTICHKLVTGTVDHPGDTCETCQTICLTPDAPATTNGGMNCSMSLWTASPTPFDATNEVLSFYSYSTSLFSGTETYTVYSGGSIIYTGVPVSLILPYGTYVVCRSVTYLNGEGQEETCTQCVTVCYSINVDGGGQGGGAGERKIKSNQSSGRTFSIYPNPAHNSLNVDLKLSKTAIDGLEIRDVTGRLVFKMNVSAEDGTNAHYIIPTETLTPGTYFLKVKTSDGSLSQTFTIQH